MAAILSHCVANSRKVGWESLWEGFPCANGMAVASDTLYPVGFVGILRANGGNDVARS